MVGPLAAIAAEVASKSKIAEQAFLDVYFLGLSGQYANCPCATSLKVQAAESDNVGGGGGDSNRADTAPLTRVPGVPASHEMVRALLIVSDPKPPPPRQLISPPAAVAAVCGRKGLAWLRAAAWVGVIADAGDPGPGGLCIRRRKPEEAQERC